MLTMMMSIVHRMTGIALYAGSLLLAWWLLAVASGPNAYATFQSVASSFIGRVVLFGYTWALIHHMLGGLRHLIWDTGHGFGPAEREWLVTMCADLTALTPEFVSKRSSVLEGTARRTLGMLGDLPQIARTPAMVVCSGAKSILDVGATAELLETLGNPVLGWNTATLPLFYSSGGGPAVSAVVSGAAGFVGSHMCDRLLAEGIAVSGYSSPESGASSWCPGLTKANGGGLALGVCEKAVVHIQAWSLVSTTYTPPPIVRLKPE